MAKRPTGDHDLNRNENDLNRHDTDDNDTDTARNTLDDNRDIDNVNNDDKGYNDNTNVNDPNNNDRNRHNFAEDDRSRRLVAASTFTGMDFADVAKLASVDDDKNPLDRIGKVIKTYENNKSTIDFILGFILKLFRKGNVAVKRDEDGSIAVKPIDPKGPDAPVKLPPDAPTAFYTELKAKAFFCENKAEGRLYKKPEFDEILNPNGSLAQMLGDRMHLDITPFRDKNEVRQHEKHPLDDNGDPALRYRWWINGEQQHDTDNDHFNLGSVRDDAGCTPTLKLLEQFGPGRHEVTFQAYIPGEWNNGLDVESNIVTWYCD